MMAPAFPISAFCMRSGDPPTIPSSPKASACGRTFRGLCFNNSLLRPPLTSNVKLTQERPDLFGQVQSSVLAVAGALQSKFGPASENYFNAKRSVTARHQLGELSENLAFEYARAHKIEEATVGLSLLCSLPVSAVERALANTEMTLVLAKANDFKWETAMVPAVSACQGPPHHGKRPGRYESAIFQAERQDISGNSDLLSTAQAGSISPTGSVAIAGASLNLA